MSSELTGEEKQKLSSAVGAIQDVFTSPDGKLGQTNFGRALHRNRGYKTI